MTAAGAIAGDDVLDEVLVETEFLRIAYRPGAADRLVVAFAGLGKPFGAAPMAEFARSAWRDGGHSVVFVSDRKGIWFTGPGVAEMIVATIRQLHTRIGAPKLITVGNSMGGYGAILFAGPLGAEAAIAFGPQFSIRAGAVPGETRWQGAARRSFGELPTLADALLADLPFLVTHGLAEEDRFQAAAFPQTANIAHVVYPHLNHNTARAIRKAGGMAALFEAGFERDQDRMSRIAEDAGGVPRAVAEAEIRRSMPLSDEVFIKAGWWLFVICALCFVAVALINRDWLSLIGSLAFLAANALFMVPVYRRRK